jgi:hypothetical protein
LVFSVVDGYTTKPVVLSESTSTLAFAETTIVMWAGNLR